MINFSKFFLKSDKVIYGLVYILCLIFRLFNYFLKFYSNVKNFIKRTPF